MGDFLLLLFIFFVVLPLLNIGWRVYKLQRNIKKAARQMQDRFNAAQTAPRPERHRKIDPSVAETAYFEDVSDAAPSASSESTARTSVRPESQVEDAVWEDIN